VCGYYNRGEEKNQPETTKLRYDEGKRREFYFSLRGGRRAWRREGVHTERNAILGILPGSARIIPPPRR